MCSSSLAPRTFAVSWLSGLRTALRNLPVVRAAETCAQSACQALNTSEARNRHPTWIAGPRSVTGEGGSCRSSHRPSFLHGGVPDVVGSGRCSVPREAHRVLEVFRLWIDRRHRLVLEVLLSCRYSCSTTWTRCLWTGSRQRMQNVGRTPLAPARGRGNLAHPRPTDFGSAAGLPQTHSAGIWSTHFPSRHGGRQGCGLHEPERHRRSVQGMRPQVLGLSDGGCSTETQVWSDTVVLDDRFGWARCWCSLHQSRSGQPCLFVLHQEEYRGRWQELDRTIGLPQLLLDQLRHGGASPGAPAGLRPMHGILDQFFDMPNWDRFRMVYGRAGRGDDQMRPSASFHQQTTGSAREKPQEAAGFPAQWTIVRGTRSGALST